MNFSLICRHLSMCQPLVMFGIILALVFIFTDSNVSAQTTNQTTSISETTYQRTYIGQNAISKTTFQRTSTGPIAISEVDPDGKFIVLENTSIGPNRRDVNLDSWKLVRNVDGKRNYIYPFRNFTLKSGKKVKVLGRGAANEAGLDDLVFREQDSWGVGTQVTTTLVNDKEEDKASHVQKTVYV